MEEEVVEALQSYTDPTWSRGYGTSGDYGSQSKSPDI